MCGKFILGEVDYMDIEIHKLTPELAEDYAYFFDETPHNDEFKRKCYCVSWRTDTAKGERWPDKTAERRAVAVERVKNGHIRGYLAYHENKIVGWCNANTKSDCQKVIKHSRPLVEDCKDDEKIKFIFCFAIAPDYRRKGVASRLLEYICNDAKSDGYDFVEVFTTKEFANDGFRGVFEMYEKHGFYIYAEKDGKVVMRRILV
jgi:ribosomal protein S18 acetylase RimI-like enzyme